MGCGKSKHAVVTENTITKKPNAGKDVETIPDQTTNETNVGKEGKIVEEKESDEEKKGGECNVAEIKEGGRIEDLISEGISGKTEYYSPIAKHGVSLSDDILKPEKVVVEEEKVLPQETDNKKENEVAVNVPETNPVKEEVVPLPKVEEITKVVNLIEEKPVKDVIPKVEECKKEVETLLNEEVVPKVEESKKEVENPVKEEVVPKVEEITQAMNVIESPVKEVVPKVEESPLKEVVPKVEESKKEFENPEKEQVVPKVEETKEEDVKVNEGYPVKEEILAVQQEKVSTNTLEEKISVANEETATETSASDSKTN